MHLLFLIMLVSTTWFIGIKEIREEYTSEVWMVQVNAENGGLQGKINGAETRQGIAIFNNKFCRTIWVCYTCITFITNKTC